jgi:hypothetical protein
MLKGKFLNRVLKKDKIIDLGNLGTIGDSFLAGIAQNEGRLGPMFALMMV